MKKDEIQKQLGTNVRNFRAKLQISQEELASLCDLDRTYIGAIERGERNVSIYNIYKIANALNINIKELFNGLS